MLGGCELALLCDFIIASEDAQFEQPEIKLGILPGIGWTRSVGKALAMDLVLTGRTISADEAFRAGLVSRVVPKDQLVQTTLEAAHTIAGFSRPAVKMVRPPSICRWRRRWARVCAHERLFFQAAFAAEGRRKV